MADKGLECQRNAFDFRQQIQVSCALAEILISLSASTRCSDGGGVPAQATRYPGMVEDVEHKRESTRIDPYI